MIELLLLLSLNSPHYCLYIPDWYTENFWLVQEKKITKQDLWESYYYLSSKHVIDIEKCSKGINWQLWRVNLP